MPNFIPLYEGDFWDLTKAYTRRRSIGIWNGDSIWFRGWDMQYEIWGLVLEVEAFLNIIQVVNFLICNAVSRCQSEIEFARISNNIDSILLAFTWMRQNYGWRFAGCGNPAMRTYWDLRRPAGLVHHPDIIPSGRLSASRKGLMDSITTIGSYFFGSGHRDRTYAIIAFGDGVNCASKAFSPESLEGTTQGIVRRLPLCIMSKRPAMFASLVDTLPKYPRISTRVVLYDLTSDPLKVIALYERRWRGCGGEEALLFSSIKTKQVSWASRVGPHYVWGALLSKNEWPKRLCTNSISRIGRWRKLFVLWQANAKYVSIFILKFIIPFILLTDPTTPYIRPPATTQILYF